MYFRACEAFVAIQSRPPLGSPRLDDEQHSSILRIVYPPHRRSSASSVLRTLARPPTHGPMTTLILPAALASPALRKRRAYCTVLTDVVRAAADAQDALDTFAGLLLEDRMSRFTKFDAHVGEAGCHLRATMLRELFLSCKAEMAASPAPSSLPPWMAEANARLSTLRRAAEDMCSRLSRHRADPRDLGLGLKHDTTEHMVRVLAGSDHHAASKPRLDQRRPFASPPSSSRLDDCPKVAWNLRNRGVLLRFLVYCHALSKYKQFIMGPLGGACRLRPEWASDEGYRLIEPYWDMSNDAYQAAKCTRIRSELMSLQVWMSKLSCAWLHSLSNQLSPSSVPSTLVRSSMETADRGIVAAACYPAFVLLRHLWATTHSDVLLVDRHFCSRGFHYHVMRCRLRLVPDASSPESAARVHWSLDETDVQGLADDDDDVSPHIVVMGNSIRGPATAFVDRVLAAQGCAPPTSRPHRDDACPEYRAHQSQIRRADHDRIARAFFAAHRSYSVPVEPFLARPEDEVIGTLLARLPPHLHAQPFHDMWKKSRSEIDELGGGRGNLATFGWQHVFTETKHGLARLLEKWIADENMMPLHA
ncbi:hypothetical protein RJ55_07308 [Drechmeria coniospora]|nr:hypothetical protein RJ55_07308 [Drechmeria coniospora]